MENFCFIIPSDKVGVLRDALYSLFERKSNALSKMKSLRIDYNYFAVEDSLSCLEFLLHELDTQYEIDFKSE